MTMSKEMERLKSKMELYKGLINLYDALNFIYKSNKYDKIIDGIFHMTIQNFIIMRRNKLYVMYNYNFINSNYYTISILNNMYSRRYLTSFKII